ncbi:hypothetical protein C4A76_24815 [Brevibacillus laterosporus]|uniref:AAA domain-containing protein n=1 Tax=Brevibacillus laterosporus TaxID=1465 RepID=UPI000CE42CB9|nr:AAA domain-containing protein [Brevibacillus laterosporus]PPA80908.1 hypothetical protein C4A76_24815 [Brevibacillus laterosporus]
MKWINNDHYKVITELIGGNLSKVFRCKDIENDDEVVIKTFSYTDSENGSFYSKLFFREVENLKNLNHPNIVKLLNYGVDQKNNVFFMAIDYFEGQTLDKVIFKKMLSKNQKFYILFQILDALIYAHAKQLTHRDLKPSNILINESNEIYVIDFGTSKLKHSLYNEFTVLNTHTPKYASTEQKSSKDIDYRTDIYSLGMIFFEILTGEPVQEESNLRSSINENVTIASDLKSLLLEMTEPLPNDRIQTMSEVRLILKELNKKEIQGPVYGIGFTKSAMSNLHKLNFIRNLSRTEAAQVIYQDIGSSQTYMEYISVQESQQSYKLYGKQLEYRCVVDQRTGKTLTIINVHFKNTITHEMNKERAIPVIGEWEVYQAFSDNRTNVDVNELIRQIEEKTKEFSIRERKEKLEKNSIERWNKVLRLYTENLEENRNTLKYIGIEKDAFGEKIWVELDKSLECVIFNEDQLLSMTSRQNINRTKTAGYCINIDDRKLVVQLAKDASPEDFATSGEISVDQRLVETALNRQKRAMKAVQFKELENNDLAEILFDPSTAKSSNLVLDIKYLSELDPSKEEAIEKALRAKDLFLLQGPPGTGKTTFIGELVYQIIKENPESKVLVSSQSNVAVDHALNKIKAIMPRELILRIGRRDKLSLGAERFMIEEQLDHWFGEIERLCTVFLEKYKQSVGLDENLIKQHNLILEIDQIRRRLKDNNRLKVDNHKKMSILKERYDRLKNLVNDIQLSAAKIQNKTERVNEIEFIGIVEEFREHLLSASDNFIKQMEQTFDMALQKEELEVQEDTLKTEENYLNNQLTSLKRLLGVETPEQLFSLKNQLEIQLEREKEHYNQIGKIERIQQEWINRLGTGDKLTDIMIRRSSIIGATCLGIASLSANSHGVFDWVIIDEAGRATPPELLVPMTLGKKVVLVGDHKQLPPLVDQHIQKLDLKAHNIQTKDLEISLFEELMTNINPECVGSLKEQYRMHPAIGNLISKVFYDGKLESKTTIETRSHGYSRWPKRGVVWMSTSDHPERFEQIIKQRYSHNTYLNRLEARIIFETLLAMEKEYSDQLIEKDVGIITGYQAQKAELRKLFETEYKDSFRSLKIDINTVDAFQGRETDIIFYSVVRSNKEGKVGFLSDARRLNVALSRARELLIVVGDHMAVTRIEFLSRKQINPFVKVVQYIQDNPDVCVLERIVKQ